MILSQVVLGTQEEMLGAESRLRSVSVKPREYVRIANTVDQI